MLGVIEFLFFAFCECKIFLLINRLLSILYIIITVNRFLFYSEIFEFIGNFCYKSYLMVLWIY